VRRKPQPLDAADLKIVVKDAKIYKNKLN